MPGQYTFYRLLCATPPELEGEQQLFLSVLADFGAAVTMPDWVLLAPATFRAPFDAHVAKRAVEQNIQASTFYLQMFGEQAPERVYTGFLDYALKCLADPAQPLRHVTVLFQESAGVSAEMRALRASLSEAGQCDVLGFAGMDALGKLLPDVLAAWYVHVKPQQQGQAAP